MEHKSKAQVMRTSEIVINATAYCVKSILPNDRALRDILLRVAVNEAINQAAHT